MTSCFEPVGKHIEDNPYTFRRRIVGVDGEALTQADLSAIGWSSYNVNDPGSAIASGSLTIADTVFDTLQEWDEDSTGYNFLAVIPGTAFPTGGQRVQVEVAFTIVGGTVIKVVKVVDVMPVYGS